MVCCFFAAKPASSVATRLLMTVIERQLTTTIELALVLGYTFQAHSCAAQMAYIKIGCRPPRQSRKGVDHAMYA